MRAPLRDKSAAESAANSGQAADKVVDRAIEDARADRLGDVHRAPIGGLPLEIRERPRHAKDLSVGACREREAFDRGGEQARSRGRRATPTALQIPHRARNRWWKRAHLAERRMRARAGHFASLARPARRTAADDSPRADRPRSSSTRTGGRTTWTSRRSRSGPLRRDRYLPDALRRVHPQRFEPSPMYPHAHRDSSPQTTTGRAGNVTFPLRSRDARPSRPPAVAAAPPWRSERRNSASSSRKRTRRDAPGSPRPAADLRPLRPSPLRSDV